MCKFCEKPRVTYSDLYNDAYTSIDRNLWLRNHIQEKYCTRFKFFILEHVVKMVDTQTIFQKHDRASYLLLIREFKKIKFQKKRCGAKISNAYLKYLYRPNGVMFKKSCSILTHIQGGRDSSESES